MIGLVISGKLFLLKFSFKKPISKFALWATKIQSSKNSKISGKMASIVGSFLTISLVILVRLVILEEIILPGLINLCIRSMTSPFLIFTAPNSVMPSWITERPVVSKSNDTYVACSIEVSIGL